VQCHVMQCGLCAPLCTYDTALAIPLSTRACWTGAQQSTTRVQ
jgi:hypothetical protein